MSIATSESPVSAPPSVKLGEELPLFCEKCGYGLQGAPQIRCERCEILQFHCPECGHHQPINTLRPAAQRIIGRLRAVWLAGVVFVKLNYFGWLMLAWFAMGTEWSYRYDYSFRVGNTVQSYMLVRTPLNFDQLLAFGLFALLFGLVSRMLLLRWRSSIGVGVVLALLVVAAIWIGGAMRPGFRTDVSVAPLADADWFLTLFWTAGLLFVGCVLSWPLWVALVKMFLPQAVGAQLLAWQRAQSQRSVAAMGRE